jgi:hypothetical protein
MKIVDCTVSSKKELKGVKMKGRASLVVLAAVAALVFTALPAAAGDSAEKTISLYCSDRGDLGLSHGGCVAYFTNGNTVPHDASICREPRWQEWTGARNAGQCVKALKDLKDHKKAD